MEPSDEELLGLMPQQLRDDLATVSRMAAHGAGPDVTPGLFDASLTAGALQFARAVLAHRGHQSAPPVEGEVGDPGEATDEELWDIGERHLWTGTDESVTNYRILTSFIEAARVVVARYGHQPAPPVAEGEVVKAVRPSRRQLIMLADDMGMASVSEAAEYARAVLARYGHQQAPPAEGEVVELVEGLQEQANYGICDVIGGDKLTRAADLLKQRHPEPVPASERLPEPADCDGEGTCWVWNRIAATWGLFRLDLTAHSHWLPAHALPLPAGEVQP